MHVSVTVLACMRECVHSFIHAYMHTHTITKGIKNKSVISPEVLEAYKYSYSQPGGLSGAINYYRCIMEQPKRDPKQNIQLPVLVIWVSFNSIVIACKRYKLCNAISGVTMVTYLMIALAGSVFIPLTVDRAYAKIFLVLCVFHKK